MVSELQIKYNHQMEQLSSVTSECSNWRSLPRKCGNDTIKVGALLDAPKDKIKFFESQIAVVWKEKRPTLLTETHVLQM